MNILSTEHSTRLPDYLASKGVDVSSDCTITGGQTQQLTDIQQCAGYCDGRYTFEGPTYSIDGTARTPFERCDDSEPSCCQINSYVGDPIVVTCTIEGGSKMFTIDIADSCTSCTGSGPD